MDLDALTAWMREFGRLISDNRDLLTDLDAAIGDADHGVNMERAMTTVVHALDTDRAATVAGLLKQVALEIVSAAGGASGPLYGTYFLRMASAVGEVEVLDPQGFSIAMQAGVEGLVARGKAAAGDKTMFDALAPASEALGKALASGESLRDALRAASAAANEGRDATTPLVGRKGRASYLGERGIGHQDPGATSAALLVAAAAATLPGS
ncbi:dihydroxyacetone kinase subunit DhaL [Antrihabitans sp. YC2-6]|uniref:dihydroxyacetone kinase subunit DhaL n=1 Tax=Antrihabitans sp. YC2-6 TaxID=2799498 RepID=UPI0018F2B597|nr:dihydroxyacetone kinase subunit DhaL [Antrihabitans sp. YC2-6]MBJ8345235.1 dihydroxyacetone kinase subunit L [Antrihabitans sp. YC2-6]